MEVQVEYEEKVEKQLSRGGTPLRAIFLFGVLVVAGAMALFGGGSLRNHFLSSELKQSKQTIIFEYDEALARQLGPENPYSQKSGPNRSLRPR